MSCPSSSVWAYLLQLFICRLGHRFCLGHLWMSYMHNVAAHCYDLCVLDPWNYMVLNNEMRLRRWKVEGKLSLVWTTVRDWCWDGAGFLFINISSAAPYVDICNPWKAIGAKPWNLGSNMRWVPQGFEEHTTYTRIWSRIIPAFVSTKIRSWGGSVSILRKKKRGC